MSKASIHALKVRQSVQDSIEKAALEEVLIDATYCTQSSAYFEPFTLDKVEQ